MGRPSRIAAPPISHTGCSPAEGGILALAAEQSWRDSSPAGQDMPSKQKNGDCREISPWARVFLARRPAHCDSKSNYIVGSVLAAAALPRSGRFAASVCLSRIATAMPFDDDRFRAANPRQRPTLVLATTGGGSRAISRLLTVPGASRSVLEAIVPYAEPALARFLGGKPDQYCSPATARAMAMAAYRRALDYADSPAMAVGLGCTAGLATRPAEAWPASFARRGPDARSDAAGVARIGKRSPHSRRRRNAGGRHRVESAGRVLAACRPRPGGFDRRRTTPREQRRRAEPVAGAVGRRNRSAAGQSARRGSLAAQGDFFGGVSSVARGSPGDGSRRGPTARRRRSSSKSRSSTPTNRRSTIWRSTAASGNSRRTSRSGCRVPPRSSKNRCSFPGVTFVVGVDTIERIAAARFYGGDPAAVDRAMQTIGCPRVPIPGLRPQPRGPVSHAGRPGPAAGGGRSVPRSPRRSCFASISRPPRCAARRSRRTE